MKAHHVPGEAKSRTIVNALTREMVRDAMRVADGNHEKAAEALGLVPYTRTRLRAPASQLRAKINAWAKTSRPLLHALVWLALASPLAGQSGTLGERFEFFTGCAPVRLGVYVGTGGLFASPAEALGLTEERVHTTVANSLRDAGVPYTVGGIGGAGPSLSVHIEAHGSGLGTDRVAYLVRTEFAKRVRDLSPDFGDESRDIWGEGWAVTWSYFAVLDPSLPADFAIGGVSASVRVFTTAYLRVNEGYC